MGRVHAKHDGFLEPVTAGLEVVADPLGNAGGAVVNDEGVIKVFLVVQAVFNFMAVLVHLAGHGAVAFHVNIQVNLDDLVRGQKAIAYALLQAVGEHGSAKIIAVGNVLGLGRRGGHTDLGGGTEILQYFAPGRVFGGAATVAFVNHDQVEKARAEFFENFLALFGAGDGLVQPQVNFIGGVDAAFVVGATVHGQGYFNLAPISTLDGFGVDTELGHGTAKWAEVVDHGLVNQYVAVGQKQDAFLLPRLPQPPDDLKRGVGLAGAGGHDQQDAVLTFGNSFHRRVHGVALVITRLFATAVIKVRLLDYLFLCRGQPFPSQIAAPKLSRTGKVVQFQSGFELHRGAGAVMQHKAVTVTGENKGNVECGGVVQRLLHAVANSFEVVLGLNQGNGEVPDVKHIVGALGFAACNQLTAHNDPARRESHLATNGGLRPTSLIQSRGNEFRAGVVFAEVPFAHADSAL